MKKINLFKIFVISTFCALSSCSKDIAIETQVGTSGSKMPVKASSYAASYSASSWMGLLSDNSSLAKITIPGTHDACARVEPIAGTAKCQNLSLTDQFNAGVRFVDIRCRHINNAFAIHHGQVYQNMNFDDVLNATIAFLNSNPSECIIMSIKEEYNASNNTRSFEATLDTYIAKNPGKWNLGATIPSLGNVRGKIVLLRRFGTGNTKGIDASNWSDNTTFSINNSNANLRVQDYYNVSGTDAKWTSVSNLLNEAAAGNYETMYLNFTSGVKSFIGIPSITTVSNAINPKVNDFFNANTSGRYGIIIMDFADATKCTRIINTNVPITSGIYSIISKQSGLVMDDPNFSTIEGTNIIVYNNVGSINQKWAFTPTGGGYYSIINQKSNLAIDGGANIQTTLLQQWTSNFTQDQLWRVKPTLDGYSLISQQTGLAIDGAANASDVKIQLWGANATPNQIWFIQ